MWTLVRHRNGQEVPIKVSVLDVFRSGGRRDKKPSEESHLTKPKANTKATVAPKPQGGGSNGGGNDNKKKNDTSTNTGNTSNNPSSSSWSTSPPEIWTPEDDAQLLSLKSSNKTISWKKVCAGLSENHTSETQAKARYKEIEGKSVGGGGGGGDGGSTAPEGGCGDDEKAKKEEERKAKNEKAKADGLAREAAAKAGKDDGGEQQQQQQQQQPPKKGILKVDTPHPSLPPLRWVPLLTHPLKTSATSREKELKDVAARYDKDKWLAVASRHFDRTGQRISPEMAREMCGATD